MKVLSALLICLLSTAYLSGQSLERTVFSSCGGDATIGIWHYDFTFGEPIIGTVFSTSPIMTMGFQQPLITSPLLAESLQFQAELQGKDGLLRWELEGLEGWEGRFSIERSRDGQTFQSIGQVLSDMTQLPVYDFTDIQVANHFRDRVYYRLHLSAPDGRQGFSQIVELSLPSQNLSDELKVYPNPTRNMIQAEWQTEGKTQVKIFDLNGHLIHQWSQENPGFIWDARSLAAGTYLIQVSGASCFFQKKFIRY